MKCLNIKQIVAAFFSLLIASFLATSCVSSPPDWYLNRSVDNGFIMGVGEGETKARARTSALGNIAEQVEVRVSVETIVKEKDAEGLSSLLFEQDIVTATDIVLAGAEMILEEKRGGLYYTLYRYDNRPLRIRVLEELRKDKIAPPFSGGGGSFQQSLPFYRFLTGNKVPDYFLLSHSNQVWSLSVGNRSFYLSGRELSEDFFSSGGEGEIALVQGPLRGSVVVGQSPDALRQGQEFSLKITPPVTGFLSLFYVDNAGITQGLLENEPVREGNAFLYPDPEVYPNGLIAEPADRFTFSTDMLLGLFTAESLDHFAGIASVSEHSVDGDNSGLYSYGRLLELLKDGPSGLVWCSRIIHVSGNKFE